MRLLTIVRSLIALGPWADRSRYEIETHDSITGERASFLFGEYEDAFDGQRRKYPHDQVNYDEASFHDALGDPRFLKIILMYDSEPIGFALLTKPGNSHLAPWVSPEAFGDPEKLAYVTVIYIFKGLRRTSHHGEHFCFLLIQELTQRYKGACFGFDIAFAKRGLALAIQTAGFMQGFKVSLLGKQEYWIMRT